MKIHFAQRTLTLPGLYEGYDDVPGLALTAHLHGWEFPVGAPRGEARFRVEIHQEHGPDHADMVGAGFVRTTHDKVLEWRAPLPLMQALLDGLFVHEAIRLFFTQAATEALQLPETHEDGQPPKRVPLSALKAGRNPFLTD